MVVEGNIKRFLEGTDENRNPHNTPFRILLNIPDEPIFEDEDEDLYKEVTAEGVFYNALGIKQQSGIEP